MKKFKQLISEIAGTQPDLKSQTTLYMPKAQGERKFVKLHSQNVVDYPVSNKDGLPFRDDNIKAPGPQHKKPASYEPPHEPAQMYKAANEEVEHIDESMKRAVDDVFELTHADSKNPPEPSVRQRYGRQAIHRGTYDDIIKMVASHHNIDPKDLHKAHMASQFPYLKNESEDYPFSNGFRDRKSRDKFHDIERKLSRGMEPGKPVPRYPHDEPGTEYIKGWKVFPTKHKTGITVAYDHEGELRTYPNRDEALHAAHNEPRPLGVKYESKSLDTDQEIKNYLAKGGTIKQGKPRTAKGISYMRGMSRQKGSSSAAKAAYTSYREEVDLDEKHLTRNELKKREEIAAAMEKKTPEMSMGKKMAIATSIAKRVTEEEILEAPQSVIGSHQVAARQVSKQIEKAKAKGMNTTDLEKKLQHHQNQITRLKAGKMEEENSFEYSNILDVLDNIIEAQEQAEICFEDGSSIFIDGELAEALMLVFENIDEEDQDSLFEMLTTNSVTFNEALLMCHDILIEENNRSEVE